MFYSQVILAKKGPLAKVWLAAHWGDKKLARPQIFATDISQSCVDIMNPSVPLALRLSGHLLLGVVRIYSRKVKYVLNDCTEAMLKLQMAFSKQGGAQVTQLDGSGTNIKGVGGRELLSDKEAPTHQLVSNFGEYDQVHVVEGFCLPLPEDNEWILAEDDDVENAGGLLLTAHLPTGGTTQQKSRGVSPEQHLPPEETWAAFDPDGEDDDDEDDENDTNVNANADKTANKNKNDEEQSQVSDIELVRAANNDSMMSDDQLGRSTSMIGDKSALTEEGAVLTTPGGAGSGAAGRPGGDVFNPEDDDNFNIPFEEDSEDEQGGGGGGDFTDGVGVGGPPNLDLSREGTGTPAGGPPNLDLSRDSADTPLGGANSVTNLSVPGLALDDDSATQASNNTKRSLDEEGKKPRRRRRKRRKVVIDNNETELTNDHIRGMISDTSDIVRVMIHPATIWDEEGLGRDYKTLVKDRLALEGVTIQTTNGNGITGSSSSGNNKKNSKKNMDDLVIPSLTRPFLVDEGSMGGPQLHPDLAKLWQDNYWKALDQPCPYKRDVEEEEEEEEEQQQQQPVEDVELARRGSGTNADDESDAGTQLSDLNVEKEQEQQPEQEGGTGPPLIDEDENNFPVEEEEEEEEEPAEFPVPDFGDEKNNLTLNRTPDEDDMLELGMVNEFILDSDEEDDEDEDDIANRQALGDVASSTTKWHKHTVRVYQHLKKSMKDPNSTEDAAADDDSDASPKQDLPEQIMFKQLTKNVVSRRNAASVFFEMLQLKTWDFIDLNQEDPYGDITISPGVRFSEPPPN
mmetsp:Transcript_43079/g.47952  ORF Transcript_43079/g.47952 Transcript_43079/m.47952 type:complete len:797 (+) Transcript_43079:217-2607(+)